MATEKEIEIAARAIAKIHWPTDERWKNYLSAARAALTAVEQLDARKEALTDMSPLPYTEEEAEDRQRNR